MDHDPKAKDQPEPPNNPETLDFKIGDTPLEVDLRHNKPTVADLSADKSVSIVPNKVNVVIAEIIEKLEDEENANVQDLVLQYPEFKTEVASYFDLAEKLDGLIRDQEHETEEEGEFPAVPGFRMIQKVGKGGMGIVYHAYQESLDRDVALKFLPKTLLSDKQRLKRFRFEATVAGRINESHILPVYDVLLHNSNPVLVLPYISGGDLDQIIRQRQMVLEGKLNPDEAHPWAKLATKIYTEKVLGILDQIASAVSVVHDHGIMHRDIKPSNILVDEKGNAWLTDFGLARLVNQDTITVDGAMLGTPGFMSPEQCTDASGIDFCSDVFATGVTFYYALTLGLPFQKGVITSNQDAPRNLRKKNEYLDKNTCDVVTKSISPKRRHRYKSGSDLKGDWDRARAGQKPIGRPPISKLAKTSIYSAVTVILFAVVGLFAYNLPDSSANSDEINDAYEGKQSVFIKTVPPADRGVLVPLHPDSEYPQPEKKVTLKKDGRILKADDVLPGKYLVVVEKKGHGFHEVYRTVPQISEKTTKEYLWHLSWKRRNQNQIILPTVFVPKSTNSPDKMVLLKGSEKFMVGVADSEKKKISLFRHSRKILPFYMDQFETDHMSYYQLLSRFRPQISLMGLQPYKSQSVRPAQFIRFDQAVQHAELAGKRLPTEFEYEFASTNGGTTRFPWGDEFITHIKQKDFEKYRLSKETKDKTRSNPPIYGLYSGVAEWTQSRDYPYPRKNQNRQIIQPSPYRVARGLPIFLLNQEETIQTKEKIDPKCRLYLLRNSPTYRTGYRFVRSKSPQFLD